MTDSADPALEAAWSHTPLLRDREWMLFVDGENFTKRGQEHLPKYGVNIRPGPAWRRDVYLWHPVVNYRATSATFAHDISASSWPFAARRAYYYTAMEAGEPEWTETRLGLRGLGFEPRLFKRTRGRSKAVDVALTTDVLTLGAEGRYEVAVIVAGDGDYVPLIEGVKRFGHQVIVAFFDGQGLSPELRIAADDFVDLTGWMKEMWGAA